MIKYLAILGLFVLLSSKGVCQDNSCASSPRKDYSELNLISVMDSGQRWNVPVLFHVVYNTPNQNVPDSILLGLLETLNADFLTSNADTNFLPAEFKGTLGKANINFFLAKTLPNGVFTTGIIRRKTSLKEFKVREREVFKISSLVSNRSYLNVYVCNIKKSNAYTPSEDNDRYNGIVIDFERVFKGSRTLTHEAGHWLDLRHIFAERNCDNKNLVEDTPAQKKHKHTQPTYPLIECGSSVMFMNYMDYTKQRIFFTVGQVVLMRNHITKYKNFTE